MRFKLNQYQLNDRPRQPVASEETKTCDDVVKDWRWC